MMKGVVYLLSGTESNEIVFRSSWCEEDMNEKIGLQKGRSEFLRNGLGTTAKRRYSLGPALYYVPSCYASTSNN